MHFSFISKAQIRRAMLFCDSSYSSSFPLSLSSQIMNLHVLSLVNISLAYTVHSDVVQLLKETVLSLSSTWL